MQPSLCPGDIRDHSGGCARALQLTYVETPVSLLLGDYFSGFLKMIERFYQVHNSRSGKVASALSKT
jgi:hypothetical protein